MRQAQDSAGRTTAGACARSIGEIEVDTMASSLWARPRSWPVAPC